MMRATMAQVLDDDPRDIAGGEVLYEDAFYEILLRLPAKTLCRLRVVCRSWRSITTDPQFIKAHEVHHRHEPPLLLVRQSGGTDIYVTDFAGDTVKRVRWSTLLAAAQPREHLGPICLIRTPICIAVLDPAAGAVTAGLPVDYLDAMAARRLGVSAGYEAHYALGRLAATGEHKALRILRPTMDNRHQEQQCDVFTLDGSHRRRRVWRKRRDPPFPVLPSGTIHDVVIGGIVYFLSEYLIPDDVNEPEPDCIWTFDLATEEWAPDPLRGPLSIHGTYNDGGLEPYIDRRCELRLGQVSGGLVIVRDKGWRDDNSTVDLWFMEEEGTWVKRFSVQKHVPPEVEDEDHPRPLVVMDDGRVVLSVKRRIRRRYLQRYGGGSSRDAVVGVVRVYDPRNGACTHVIERRHVVGVYTGSCLLRLRKKDQLL